MFTAQQLQAAPYSQDIQKWFLMWSATFLFLRNVLFRSKTADFSNRFVSIVHALIAIYLSYESFESIDSSMFDKVGTKNTPAQTYCMAVSLSYFIYDCLYCIVTFEFDAVVHHIFTIGGLTSGVVNQKSGVELVGCLVEM